MSQSIWKAFSVQSPQMDISFAPSLELRPTNAAPSSQISINMDQIKAWDLFGAAVSNSADPESIPLEERIDATLTGIVYSSNPKVARAIIRMKNSKKQKHYRIDDPLDNSDAIVSAIERDRVTLYLNGKTQTLLLYQDKDKKDKSKVDLKANQIIDKRSDQAARNAAEKFRSQLAADVTQLRKLLRFSAVRQNKAIIGYKIAPRRSHKEFKALGFNTGDIITAVDNIPLNNLSNLQKVMQAMENGGTLSFYIKRGNSVVELLVDTG
jgi:general secretion pathway protein C